MERRNKIEGKKMDRKKRKDSGKEDGWKEGRK